MTASIPEPTAEAFARHEAFAHPTTGRWTPFAEAATATLRTTHFDVAVTAETAAEGATTYTVAVRLPMLSAATADTVGPAVEAGWLETLELRLGDAPMATRTDLQLESSTLDRDGGWAIARYTYTDDDPDRAVATAKTLAEYVEGTYVEGIVPGYEYAEPVASLLARAGDGADTAGKGPTPL